MNIGLLKKSRPQRKNSPQLVHSSKAESIRTRQVKESQKKAGANKVIAHIVSAPFPPVMVRGGAYGIPLVRRAPTRPRRKLAIALNKLGAELLFPAIPDIKPGWRILSGFFVLLFGMGIIISFSTPEFGINQVEVYGLQRLSVADLESTFRFRDLRVFSAAPEKITSDVEDAFPELKEVRVKVTLPDKLVINVVERQPIVAWKYTDMLIWIDSEGVLFPARGEAGSLLNIQAEEAPPLLSLEPPSQIVSVEEAPINLGEQIAQPSQRLVDPVLLNTALTLSQQIPADTTLVFNDRNGMGWKDPSGWDVFVGRNLTNLDQKLIVYQGVKEYLGKQGIRPKLISVEHIHAPYYRVE